MILIFVTGCTSSKSNAQVVKVHPNGTWKLPIQSRHYIHNVVVSRVFENRTVLAVLSLNSNETPHIYDGRYENRTKLKRHHGGYVVDIVFLNATFADGGTYSSLVSAHHETITVCHRIYVIGWYFKNTLKNLDTLNYICVGLRQNNKQCPVLGPNQQSDLGLYLLVCPSILKNCYSKLSYFISN